MEKRQRTQFWKENVRGLRLLVQFSLHRPPYSAEKPPLTEGELKRREGQPLTSNRARLEQGDLTAKSELPLVHVLWEGTEGQGMLPRQGSVFTPVWKPFQRFLSLEC